MNFKQLLLSSKSVDMVNLNKKAVDFDDRVMNGKLILIILIDSKSMNQHFCLQISISVGNMLLQHLKRCKYSHEKIRIGNLL